MSNDLKKESAHAPQLHPAVAPIAPTNIPVIDDAIPDNIPVVPGDEPKIETYSGRFTEIATGQEFALSVVEPGLARDSRTHFLRNSKKFWNGTEENFRAEFEKK